MILPYDCLIEIFIKGGIKLLFNSSILNKEIRKTLSNKYKYIQYGYKFINAYCLITNKNANLLLKVIPILNYPKFYNIERKYINTILYEYNLNNIDYHEYLNVVEIKNHISKKDNYLFHKKIHIEIHNTFIKNWSPEQKIITGNIIGYVPVGNTKLLIMADKLYIARTDTDFYTTYINTFDELMVEYS